MPSGTGWEDLGARALARQFPGGATAPSSAEAVAAAIRHMGPVQSQTARSPFLGLAARFPGTTRAAVTAAYESLGIVRGSTLRGTVHTVAAADHPLHEAATRFGQAPRWRRFLDLEMPEVTELWTALEEHAWEQWRPAAELTARLGSWLESHGHQPSLELDNGVGRYLAVGHGGLIRRPLRGGWEGQGAPGYRTAAALLGDRSAALADVDGSLAQLFETHLTAHGPASPQDLAWWSGVGRKTVLRVLERLALRSEPGPDGREYLELAGVPAQRAADVSGVRLLPEYDALMCAYQPDSRRRFAEPSHLKALWNFKNGQIAPPMLVDGRFTGYWRAMGSARRRPLEVVWFARTRKPRRSELEAPVSALEAVLDIEITEVTVRREVV